MTVHFHLNGDTVSVEADPTTPLIYVLRNDLGLPGTRFGCGLEQCGACLVLVDEAPAFACTLPIDAVADRSVRTVDGLAKGATLHPVQQALLDEQAGQCGYCLGGITMALVHLLDHHPAPTRAAVIETLDKHLCRCGAHPRILRAVDRVIAGAVA